jgi:hypothetical protein
MPCTAPSITLLEPFRRLLPLHPAPSLAATFAFADLLQLQCLTTARRSTAFWCVPYCTARPYASGTSARW